MGSDAVADAGAGWRVLCSAGRQPPLRLGDALSHRGDQQAAAAAAPAPAARVIKDAPAAPGASGGGATAAAAASTAAAAVGGVFEDAGNEIADIDTRLQALQSFLQMAKKTAVS
jgi:coiled-coil domain-containing protein 61